MTRPIAVASLVTTLIAFGACVDEERPPPSGGADLSTGPSSGAGKTKGPVGGGGANAGGAGGDGGSGGTATGTGGAIDPGSDCDDSGDCTTCINCSVLADCTSVDIECNNDPTCIDALACYAGCASNNPGDPNGYADCVSICQATQVGWPTANALISCACSQDCPKDCALEQPFDCIEQLFP